MGRLTWSYRKPQRYEKLHIHRASFNGATVAEVRRHNENSEYGAVHHLTQQERIFNTLEAAKEWVRGQHVQWFKSVQWA